MASEDKKNNSIPLKRVALYKHGIGYFERHGKFKGPGEIELMCGPDEIDDMLKSLLVLSTGGQTISAITYESSKTLETRLSEFGFDLRTCQGMIQLIGQLKGAPVTVDHSGESITGRVIGLDETKQVVGNAVVSEWQVVLYSDEKKLQRIALASIKHIAVNDASLAQEIQQQLELLFQATRKKDQKLLKVQVREGDEQELTIAYSIPSPIWKTSYRLVSTEDDNLIIQGTAIVDNTQEEDWNDVHMTLVSASPISFIQPLYDPVQPARRTIRAQGHNSTGPVVTERAQKAASSLMGQLVRDQSPAPAQAQGAWGAGAASYGSPANAPASPPRAGIQSFGGMALSAGEIDEFIEKAMSPSSIASADVGVSAQATGELFEYRISAPVTVPKNSSALITIVQQNIEGERIALYNEARNAKNPYCAIRLKNTTGLTLESGPVTIMEGNSYAGEALLDVVKPDDTRFVVYAIDLSVHVVVRQQSQKKPFWRVRIMNSYMYFDNKVQTTKHYNLENLTDKKKVVFVEHPVTAHLKYVGLQKPVETTQNFYRFKVELEPKESTTLPVMEETDTQTTVYLENCDEFELSELTWALAQNYVDAKFTKVLQEVTKRREEIYVLQRNESQLKEQITRCQADQERARENVRTLGTGGDRYRKAIDSAEDEIVKTGLELSQTITKLNELRIEFRSFLTKQFESEIAEKDRVAQV
ncbi:MAG TPA: hypothetical protein V6C69_03030 [Trichormus sp.]